MRPPALSTAWSLRGTQLVLELAYGAPPTATGRGAAILCYLAQRHGWEGLYPTKLRERASVDEYLHWHHANAREYAAPVPRSSAHSSICFHGAHAKPQHARLL